MAQDWISSSDADAVDEFDSAVLGLLTWDSRSTGAPYSKPGNRCLCNEQCVCSSSRRPLGAALQSGRDDAVAGASIHGRSTDFRRVNRFHQSYGGDSKGRSKPECVVAPSRPYIYHSQLAGSWVEGPG